MEDKKRKYSAKCGNLVLIFVMALAGFVALAGFAVDASFFVLTRFKLQKATETTAMATASYLKQGTAQTQAPEIFKLFQAKGSELEHGKITNIKEGTVSIEGTTHPAVEIETQASAPTHFLRIVGLSHITFNAKAGAVSIEKVYNKSAGDTIELNEILTDKNGSDFKISLDSGYFVFGGFKGEDSSTMWQDLGCKASAGFIPTLVGGREYNLICADSSFDLSEDCPDGTKAGSMEFIKVFRTEACRDLREGTDVTLTVENNVKLVPTSLFE